MSSSKPLILRICLNPSPVFQLGPIPMSGFKEIKKGSVKVLILKNYLDFKKQRLWKGF